MPTTVEDIKQDGDWCCAFQEAFNGCYTLAEGMPHPIDSVAEVIAADEGEHDAADWVCVVRLKDGRYAKVFAGCDYTGWD